MDRIVQLLINAGALYVAVLLVPGLDFDFAPEGAWLKFLLVAFIFGLVNTFVRPILQIFTLPITLMTLGLFLLVINALMLLLTSAISDQLQLGLTVAGFIDALLGAIVISVVGFVLSMVIGTARRVV
ncbi:MAG: phage holin family protein [Chloroflexota bacterium]|jgi:putative membrane protein|nr:phage holin family protein [Chloroflexota bacterium]